LQIENEKLRKLYDHVTEEIADLSREDQKHLSSNNLKNFQSLVMVEGLDAYRGFKRALSSFRSNEARKYELREQFLHGLRTTFAIEDALTLSTYIGYAARISAYAASLAGEQPEQYTPAIGKADKTPADRGSRKPTSSSGVTPFGEALAKFLEEDKKRKR